MSKVYPPPPEAWIVVRGYYGPCRFHIARGIPVREVRKVWSRWHQDAKRRWSPMANQMRALGLAVAASIERKVYIALQQEGLIPAGPVPQFAAAATPNPVKELIP